MLTSKPMAIINTMAKAFAPKAAAVGDPRKKANQVKKRKNIIQKINLDAPNIFLNQSGI